MSNSVQLHRVFSAPVERVYRAFTTADALVKWMAPHGFTAHVDQFDLREGGQYACSLPTSVQACSIHFMALIMK